MPATSIIYRREVGRYIRSPLGWIIVAVSLFAAGLVFQTQALTGEQLSAIVLEKFFWGTSGVVMFLTVVLAFRSLSEERQNHSIILLRTSPVRDTEIVLGKFLAAMTFVAIFLILSLYMPLLIKVNGKITWSQVLVGYVGLMLLGSAVSAIGLFASALTGSQVLSALLATLFVVVMVMLFPLAKRLDSPVREVLEQLDLW